MSHVEQLWLFFALVFGIMVLPGLDMAFVLGSTLAGGRRRGFAALAGIVAGGMCHVVMTAMGISVLLKLIPGAFNALLLAGALYIAWIGLSLMRSDAAPAMRPDAPRRSHAATFRQGMLTCLLNPKAYLFMLAIFPQFLRPEHGPIAMQALVLWLIIALNQLCVYGGLALIADRARAWLQGKPTAGMLATRCVGALLIAA
ncbi:MAG: LysE family translocator, partial [Rhodanobacter sp.]